LSLPLTLETSKISKILSRILDYRIGEASLLWAAVAIHAVLTILLARAWLTAVGMERVKQKRVSIGA
jgi:hypothetical protein